MRIRNLAERRSAAKWTADGTGEYQLHTPYSILHTP